LLVAHQQPNCSLFVFEEKSDINSLCYAFNQVTAQVEKQFSQQWTWHWLSRSPSSNRVAQHCMLCGAVQQLHKTRHANSPAYLSRVVL
jgi:hypothetical protein